MREPGRVDVLRRLAETIQRERRYGVVRWAAVEGVEAGTLTTRTIDRFTAGHGMRAIGDDWEELDRDTALRHLTLVLHRSMAYDTVMISRDRAGELAGQFLTLFDGGRYFTNWENAGVERPASGTWSRGSSPLTEATFNSGVLAVGCGWIGLLLVEDED